MQDLDRRGQSVQALTRYKSQPRSPAGPVAGAPPGARSGQPDSVIGIALRIGHPGVVSYVFALDQLAQVHQHLEAIDILRTARNAIVGFLAFVFVLGGLVGFFIGRAFGNRR